MDMRGIDPRDTAWEQDHARYRVHFWDVAAVTAYEYEVLDEVDVAELLTWTSRYAAERGWTYTVHARTPPAHPYECPSSADSSSVPTGTDPESAEGRSGNGSTIVSSITGAGGWGGLGMIAASEWPPQP
jgi:hypothetical protein